MKTNRKWLILLEAALAVTIIVLAAVMILGENGREPDKVSVIIQNSEDTRWSAFKYGLRMAAEDYGIEMFVVSTGETLTPEEEEKLIEWEIDHGADAVIVQPVPGAEEMLLRMERRVPVMLVGHTASKDREASALRVTGPDNYAMGVSLAEELWKDYSETMEGKTLGILTETKDTEAAADREKGFADTLKDSGAKILWSVSDPSREAMGQMLESRRKVDFVIALDDSSLKAAGARSAAKSLHGALVYGIGTSMEAAYYLDMGFAECLVVPDEFNVGYQSMAETAEKLRHYFYKMQDGSVSYTVIRRDTLFTKENQEILFTMSQ